MTTGKAILISNEATDGLAAHIARLDLPRRGISLPLEGSSERAFGSFVELWGENDILRRTIASWPFSARAWLVEEHIPVEYERTWASGEPSPGVRLISSIHRRDGMSRAEFEDYWLGPHTEVARSYTVAVWHYNQNIVVEPLTPDSGEDGFVGMHFRNAEQLRARWQDHPAEAAAGARDAARFMMVDRSLSITAIETVWEDASE